jgi:hypothetical protein
MPKNKNKITSQSSFSFSSPKIYSFVLIGYIILSAFIDRDLLVWSSIFILLIALFTYLGLKEEKNSKSCIGAIVFFGLIGFFVNLIGSLDFSYGLAQGVYKSGEVFILIYIVYVVFSVLTVVGNNMKFVVSTRRS